MIVTITFDDSTHKLVPIVPTARMIDDGEVFASDARLCWQEMINARPPFHNLAQEVASWTAEWDGIPALASKWED